MGDPQEHGEPVAVPEQQPEPEPASRSEPEAEITAEPGPGAESEAAESAAEAPASETSEAPEPEAASAASAPEAARRLKNKDRPESKDLDEQGHLVLNKRRKRRKALAIGAAGLALLMIALAGGGYVLINHFNTNIVQDNVTGMLGNQPVNSHPQAENILVMGSDSRNGLSAGYGTGLVTDQSDTMMIVHIPANRQWAEVMSVPRDSYVNIPSCKMGNGQMSQPTQFKINEAFAIGNLDGNHTDLGVACSIKTVEQDTGIYINHFMVVNFTGFQNMVSALGSVPECNTTPIDDPNSGLILSAGHHNLTPTQALAYVRARYTLGDGSDLERIGRQQAFMSSLIEKARSEILNPVAIYKFLDAATKSLTVDSQMGWVQGVYNLVASLKNIPSNKIAFFTLPTYPRSEVVPSDTANVLWTEPEDNQIFASYRNDVPASSRLFPTQPSTASSASTRPSSTASGSAGEPEGKAQPAPGTSTSATPSTDASGTPTTSTSATPGTGGSGSVSPSASPSVSPSSSPLNLQDRTANQNICAG
jgi:LCP family protein required for cell wall assembly